MRRGLTGKGGGKVIYGKGDFFHRPWEMPIDGLLYGISRYAERNSVLVKMITQAEDYSWSSAVAHCGLKEDAILSQKA